MVIILPSNGENINTGNDSNFDFSEFSNWLFSLSPIDFVIIGTIAGLLISKNLTINQQNTIGNFLELIGEVILTYNAQEITLNNKYNNPYNLSIQDLNNKIDYLYQEFPHQNSFLQLSYLLLHIFPYDSTHTLHSCYYYT